MKAILLAGGTGSRLFPVTSAVSKQILPVYDKPMIYYPMSVLMLAGIRQVLVVSTERDLPCFKNLFGDGSFLGMEISYAVQDKPRGIADAFIVGRDFIGNDCVALVLGDNIFYGQGFTECLKAAVEKVESLQGSVIFAYGVKDPSTYGVVTLDSERNPVSVCEKPSVCTDGFAIPGLYFFDNSVVEIASKLVPSKRNELEITDIHNCYLKNNMLSVEVLGRGFTWLDTGTFDRLLEASNFIAAIEKRQGVLVACLEEIAFNNGWVTKEDVKKLSEKYCNEYGAYLQLLSGENE